MDISIFACFGSAMVSTPSISYFPPSDTRQRPRSRMRRSPDSADPRDTRIACRSCQHEGMTNPTYDDVRKAAERIAGVAHRTPVFTSASFDEMAGTTTYFKMESFQRVGAFKFRGAYNALSKLDAGERERGVIAFSSGNHAQAVALAA